ncbi:MAG: hypothetical protein RLZZ516_1703 [Cyanobacteriota bacterium]
MRSAFLVSQAWRSSLQGLLSLIAIGGVFAGVADSTARAGSAPEAPTREAPARAAATPASSTAELAALVEHLRQQGAVFYGAWWCPHCTHQKELFGQEVALRLPYVECEKDDAGRQRCAAAAVRVYPTWDLKGQRREGLLTIEELRAWSGFAASR